MDTSLRGSGRGQAKFSCFLFHRPVRAEPGGVLCVWACGEPRRQGRKGGQRHEGPPAKEKDERVKEIDDKKNQNQTKTKKAAPQLQLCVVVLLLQAQGMRRFAAPGEGSLSVQSLPCSGKDEGNPGGSCT